MKKYCLTLAFCLVFALPLQARDMREASVFAKQALDQAQAKQGARTKEIHHTREDMLAEITRLTTANKTLAGNIKSITGQIKDLQAANAALDQAAANDQSAMDELSGAVRMGAGNLKALLAASMFTAWDPGRLDRLKPVLDTKRFPGIDDMKVLSDLFLEESRLTGNVEIKEGTFINDQGEAETGEILTLGGFTAAYRSQGNTGFLNYSQESNKLYALSALPSRTVQRNLDRYMDGNEDAVYIDVSRGGALRQITHKQTFTDQVKKGGLLVWPILGLGLLALFIGLERTLFLGRVHANTDKVMGKVNTLAADGRWEDCDNMVKNEKKIPVYNVLRTGLGARSEDRETLESILQEAILKELPRLERFLPMLNIMGAVAPLLGLLGTVTGMIATFHVITLYGTGDPRMMSGGISTALVTTMLGLIVAIPIMLVYTFLCRQVEHVIGDMEEKAVALTNIIFREKR
ncbi:MAG: MotA/TolQ/ExbB proton channel family protein [Desulfobacterium sp.]|nr:MotA/TolQ/ExbB proton channel family protein [Desulfobacterium sp.]